MSTPLQGLKVYVDVRSSDGKANYSACVSEQLKLLGADIHSTLSNLCTHVVFKDGKINTRLQSNKLGLLLVNVLWVETCRETDSKCDESKFPVTDDAVDTPIHLKKKTRYRSLQPASSIACKGKTTRVKSTKTENRVVDSSVTDSTLNATPLKHKGTLIKKLQWPPDHSDVCSEAELAAHEEIGEDMKKVDKRKGRRKLKRSAVFDQSISNSQDGKIHNAPSSTHLFVLSKNLSKKQESDSKEDSQFSSYDASQHFERTDYSVTNIINQIDATIEKAPVDGFADLYSDSEDDMNNPSRRTCQLTNSQKNVMDMTFEFDEVDRGDVETKKPRKRKKLQKHGGCRGGQKLKNNELDKPDKERLHESAHVSVMNSPTKMLTFNSNYADNSDIVTDLEPGTLEPDNDEITALEQIKSPTIFRSKKQKQRKSETSTALAVKNCTRKKSAVHKTKTTVNNVSLTETSLRCSKMGNVNLDQHQNDDKEPIIDENVSHLPVANSQPKDSEASTNVVQAPEITSTSDTKARRMSKRIRHSSSRLSNPEFISYQSVQEKSRKTCEVPSTLNETEEIRSNVPGTSSYSTDICDDRFNRRSPERERVSTMRKLDDSVNSTRRSDRVRKSNPKYLSNASDLVKSNPKSTMSMSSVDLSLLDQPSDKVSHSNLVDVSDGDILCTTRRSAKIVSTSKKSDNSVNDTRKSGRMKRTNPKYSLNASSSKKPSKKSTVSTADSSLLHEQSDKENAAHSPDHSVSEYSTTETPDVKKPLTRREKKAPIVPTTTDTEDSANEILNKRPQSKRKNTKKANTSCHDVSIVTKRRSDSNTPPANMKVICTTCCHRDDQAMVRTTAKLFSAAVSESVDPNTSHVVMGTPKRTINLLKAVINGAYVLSLNWVTDSISKDSWQKESKYQLTSDFPILKMKGELRRNAASMLFADLGPIFVDKETAPPQADLIDLITLCGGKVTRSRTRSRYCIGGAAEDKEHISLSEQWVLDSITQLRLQDTNKFLLFPYRSPSPEF